MPTDEDVFAVSPDGNYRVRLVPDDYPENPRKEFNHLATMVCFYSRYDLGDKHSYSSSEFIEEILEEHKPDGVWMLPLYLVDHGCLTISTGNSMFQACDSEGWDWGCIGCIFVSKVAIREEFGDLPSGKLQEKAIALLESEVREYRQYLEGDVWGWVVEKKCGECGKWKQEDSCFGYYGLEFAKTEAESMLDYYAKLEVEE